MNKENEIDDKQLTSVGRNPDIKWSDLGNSRPNLAEFVFLDLRSYLKDLTGKTVQGMEIQKAFNAARDSRKFCILPPIKINLGKVSIEITCNLWGPGGIVSSSLGRCQFFSDIDNGGDALWMEDADKFHLEGFTISEGSKVVDPSKTKNITLLRLGRYHASPPEAGACTRGYIHNILLVAGRVGLDIQGWQTVIGTIAMVYCDKPIRTDQFNAGTIDHIQFEHCNGGEFQVLNGSNINHLLIQGTIGGVTPTTFDNIAGLNVNSSWFERSGARAREPYITVGTIGKVTNINFTAGNCDDAGLGVAPVQFDEVDGYSENFRFNTGSASLGISTTERTKNHPVNPNRIVSGFHKTEQNDSFIYPAENVFPNPKFTGMRNGLPLVPIRSVITQENSNYRTGSNAMRIRGIRGRNFNYARFRESDPAVLKSLQNKNYTFAAWVYVPDLPGYSKINRRMFPGLKIQNFNSETGVSQSWVSNTAYPIPGNWQFMHIECKPTMPFDSFDYQFYVNRSGSLSDGSEYIDVDTALMFIGDWETGFSGNIIDSDLNYFKINGGNCTIRKPKAEALDHIKDSTQDWREGDRFIYTDSLQKDPMGVYCVLGGLGPLSTWANLPNLGDLI